MIRLPLNGNEQGALDLAKPEPSSRLYLCWVQSERQIAFEHFNVTDLVDELEHAAIKLALDDSESGKALSALAHKIARFSRGNHSTPILQILEENPCTCGHSALSHQRMHDGFGEGPYSCTECDCTEWQR